jgi:gluconokinase
MESISAAAARIMGRNPKQPLHAKTLARTGPSISTGKPSVRSTDLGEALPYGITAAMVVIVMGVSGSGKTTIGRLLAAELGWRFLEGDDAHPPANVEKMAAGLPLTDADRLPWLEELRVRIESCLAAGENVVVACSALKESYRRILVGGLPGVRFVHLRGTPELIRQRLEERPGHFMKAAMLPSQLAVLEAPKDAVTVDVAAPPEEIVAEIRRRL